MFEGKVLLIMECGGQQLFMLPATSGGNEYEKIFEEFADELYVNHWRSGNIKCCSVCWIFFTFTGCKQFLLLLKVIVMVFMIQPGREYMYMAMKTVPTEIRMNILMQKMMNAV